MKLSELAARSGVSPASVKFYIRLGVLRPGRKKNATTSIYDDSHIHRLALITWIRRELELPMSAIAALTAAIDDESIDNLELMGLCQEIALGTHFTAESRTSDPPRRGFEDEVVRALDTLGLPDVSGVARRAVAAVLDDLSSSGYEVGAQTVVRHVTALLEIATRNTVDITDDLSRDEICLRVIRGNALHNRLLLATSAVTHASLSGLARNSPK